MTARFAAPLKTVHVEQLDLHVTKRLAARTGHLESGVPRLARTGQRLETAGRQLANADLAQLAERIPVLCDNGNARVKPQ
jgi:hypothetical protein